MLAWITAFGCLFLLGFFLFFWGFLRKNPKQVIAAIGFVAMMVSLLAIEFNPFMSAEERALYLQLQERIQARQY